MVHKLPWKVSEILEILEGKLNGTQIHGKRFPKNWVPFARLTSFPEIPENPICVNGTFQKLKTCSNVLLMTVSDNFAPWLNRFKPSLFHAHINCAT